MPEKFRYDSTSHVYAALRILAEAGAGDANGAKLSMGKTDFKGAVKTLPPSVEQSWLCWVLVFNPGVMKWQIVPLWSYILGNVGGVTAWYYRTARAIQSILIMVFHLVVLLYVDDVFWAATDAIMPSGKIQAEWIGDVFREVVTDLLGWELDPDKETRSSELLLLGLDVRVES